MSFLIHLLHSPSLFPTFHPSVLPSLTFFLQPNFLPPSFSLTPFFLYSASPLSFPLTNQFFDILFLPFFSVYSHALSSITSSNVSSSPPANPRHALPNLCILLFILPMYMVILSVCSYLSVSSVTSFFYHPLSSLSNLRIL